MQIELTNDEAAMLHDLLVVYVSDLRMEIADTEDMTFRQRLKQQEQFLERLLGKLAEERP